MATPVVTIASGGLPVVETPLGKPVSSVVQAADGSLVLAGFTGLTRLSPSIVTASE